MRVAALHARNDSAAARCGSAAERDPGQPANLAYHPSLIAAAGLETARRECIANVSHELRTPLTVLLGFIETVRNVRLAGNAVRYTPPGGVVRLVWRASPKGAAFSVEDTGIGIEKQHIPRLTERFYRVDRDHSRQNGGTGLGLAIVKQALLRHQATLEIESEPGRGSRFTARFSAQGVVPVTA